MALLQYKEEHIFTQFCEDNLYTNRHITRLKCESKNKALKQTLFIYLFFAEANDNVWSIVHKDYRCTVSPIAPY